MPETGDFVSSTPRQPVETSAALCCSLRRPLLSSLSLHGGQNLLFRFLSASFTAIASSKPLACLGVHFVEELDLGMVIIITERE